MQFFRRKPFVHLVEQWTAFLGLAGIFGASPSHDLATDSKTVKWPPMRQHRCSSLLGYAKKKCFSALVNRVIYLWSFWENHSSLPPSFPVLRGVYQSRRRSSFDTPRDKKFDFIWALRFLQSVFDLPSKRLPPIASVGFNLSSLWLQIVFFVSKGRNVSSRLFLCMASF